jgi:hypothetical protein
LSPSNNHLIVTLVCVDVVVRLCVVYQTPHSSHGRHSFRFCRPCVLCCYSNVGRENKGDEKSDDRVTNWVPAGTRLHEQLHYISCVQTQDFRTTKQRIRPNSPIDPNKPCCKRRFSLSSGPSFKRKLPIQTSDCVLPTGTDGNRWSNLYNVCSLSED